jgi:hypothetical protein
MLRIGWNQWVGFEQLASNIISKLLLVVNN